VQPLLYIAILPVIVLLVYIYKKDAHKEPARILAKIFFLGVLTIIPALVVEIALNKICPTENVTNIIRLFVNVLIGVALVEEFFKWLVIKLFVYKTEHFDETFDAIVYAVFASLGFACLENILYVIINGFGTGVIRAITAVPLHACDGVIMGYFIGKAKLCAKDGNTSNEKLNLVLSLILPTLTHAIYDFLLFTSRVEFIIVWFIFIIAIYIICFILIKNSKKKNESVVKEVNIDIPVSMVQENNINNQNNKVQGIYCRYCGYQINNSNFCPHCGKKNE